MHKWQSLGAKMQILKTLTNISNFYQQNRGGRCCKPALVEPPFLSSPKILHSLNKPCMYTKFPLDLPQNPHNQHFKTYVNCLWTENPAPFFLWQSKIYHPRGKLNACFLSLIFCRMYMDFALGSWCYELRFLNNEVKNFWVTKTPVKYRKFCSRGNGASLY